MITPDKAAPPANPAEAAAACVAAAERAAADLRQRREAAEQAVARACAIAISADPACKQAYTRELAAFEIHGTAAQSDEQRIAEAERLERRFLRFADTARTPPPPRDDAGHHAALARLRAAAAPRAPVNIAPLLAGFANRGITLAVHKDRLRASPAALLTPHDRATLREARDALVAALTASEDF